MAKNYYYIDDSTAQGPNTLLAIANESARFGIGTTTELQVVGQIRWEANTDYAFIRFNSTSDSSPPSQLEIAVGDNGNSPGGSESVVINQYDYVTGNVVRSLKLFDNSGNTSIPQNLTVTGSVSKGSGSFVIDHPLSETKNLVHSFIEGPRADLIYRGTVTLIDGSVTINLDEEYELIPGTWKTLCRNPQVWISNIDGWTNCRGTVEDGILIIEAQTASNENVNWLVIAERQDKHMYDTEWTDNNGRPILEPVKL